MKYILLPVSPNLEMALQEIKKQNPVTPCTMMLPAGKHSDTEEVYFEQAVSKAWYDKCKALRIAPRVETTCSLTAEKCQEANIVTPDTSNTPNPESIIIIPVTKTSSEDRKFVFNVGDEKYKFFGRWDDASKSTLQQVVDAVNEAQGDKKTLWAYSQVSPSKTTYYGTVCALSSLLALAGGGALLASHCEKFNSVQVLAMALAVFLIPNLLYAAYEKGCEICTQPQPVGK